MTTSRSHSRIGRATGWCVGVFAAFVALPLAGAQTFFKWTDESGTVHFADSPPAAGQPYEQREAGPVAPAAKGQPPPPGASASGGEGGASTSELGGPARIIVTSREATPRGADTRHVVGAVKNVGGRPADHVGVTLLVLDANGQECSREDADVLPATLGAGESGNFDATVSGPCLVDGGMVDTELHWD